MTERHPVKRRRPEIHQAGRERNARLGDGMIGKEPIRLFDGRDHCVAQGERHLRQGQERCANPQFFPTDFRKADIWQPNSNLGRCELRHQRRVLRKGQHDARAEQQHHGEKVSTTEQRQRRGKQHRRDRPRLGHQSDSTEHQADAQAHHDADGDLSRHDRRHPSCQAGDRKKNPNDAGHDAGGLNRRRREQRNGDRLRDRHGADRLHRLNTEGRTIDHADCDISDTERDQHPGRIELNDCQIGGDERDECSEIAERTRDFAQIKARPRMRGCHRLFRF